MSFLILTCVHLLPLTAATTCAPDQFQCDQTLCIPASYLCDDSMDCSDGTDEEGCSKTLFLHQVILGCSALNC